MKSLLIKFFLFFCRVLSILPRTFSWWIGNILGFIWIDLFRVRRDVVLKNLTIAFPEKSEEEKLKIGRESVYTMARGAVESFSIPFWTREDFKKNYVVHGAENLQKALDMNKGVYLLSMHLGNGDLSATGIAMAGFPIHIITKRFKNKFFDELWFSVRGGQGVQFIEAHGKTTAFDILKALKKNHCVCFVIDQFMGKPFGIATTFFGKKTGTAYGLALFYLKTHSPIVHVYGFAGDDGKNHIFFDPILEIDHLISDDKDQTILRLTQFFNDQIEKTVRTHPEHWMWVHKRWKDFE